MTMINNTIGELGSTLFGFTSHPRTQSSGQLIGTFLGRSLGRVAQDKARATPWQWNFEASFYEQEAVIYIQVHGDAPTKTSPLSFLPVFSFFLSSSKLLFLKCAVFPDEPQRRRPRRARQTQNRREKLFFFFFLFLKVKKKGRWRKSNDVVTEGWMYAACALSHRLQCITSS